MASAAWIATPARDETGGADVPVLPLDEPPEEGVALPEPYIGEFYRRGAGCGLCNDVWCGDGACSCGSSWTTEMVLGEEPDPADEDFWTVAAAR